MDYFVFVETQSLYQIFQVCISLLYILSGYFYAYLAAFRDTKFDDYFDHLEILTLVFELLFLMHLVLQFFKSGEEKVKFLTIAQKYLSDGFLTDFIPIIPLQLVELKNNRNRLFYLIKLIRMEKGFALFDVDKIMRAIKKEQ